MFFVGVSSGGLALMDMFCYPRRVFQRELVRSLPVSYIDHSKLWAVFWRTRDVGYRIGHRRGSRLRPVQQLACHRQYAISGWLQGGAEIISLQRDNNPLGKIQCQYSVKKILCCQSLHSCKYIPPNIFLFRNLQETITKSDLMMTDENSHSVFYSGIHLRTTSKSILYSAYLGGPICVINAQ